ncbi:unnamed protein product [Miscanthus lutarioriparius]|uniref:Uncharacterized protein n=1 Tax=Miscanthus lutarioriparius TaxID=422564 RepID=A0A811NJI6_9POAL|nr:unnamed protein product [Miscanthus lutarioriparius]
MKVEVVETTLVPPSEATPRHALWLSNLDLAVPKTHTPLVYYYPRPDAPAGAGAVEEREGEGSFFDPARLREALARALVAFYPLAGRLAVGQGGRIEIDCTGEGALFAVARADFTGDEMFRDFEPSPEARRLLVPFAASGDPPCVLAMVQVTFLKCGGVAVGTGMHHVTMDGAGAIQFIRTWTALARGESPSWSPFHDRTLLRARSPPHVPFEHPVYSPAYLNGSPRPFVTRVYTRLRPPLPATYFGNAIVRDLVTVKVGDVLSQPLGFVADRIKRAVSRVDDAFVRSVVDYLELESEKGNQAARGQFMPESDLWVVSWLGMPIHDADFGWGRPGFVAPAQMFGSGTAYVTQGYDKDDPINVLFALEPQYLQTFEKAFYGE